MFHVGMSIKQGRGSTYLFRQGSGLLQKVDFFSTKDYFIFRWGYGFWIRQAKKHIAKNKTVGVPSAEGKLSAQWSQKHGRHEAHDPGGKRFIFLRE